MEPCQRSSEAFSRSVSAQKNSSALCSIHSVALGLMKGSSSAVYTTPSFPIKQYVLNRTQDLSGLNDCWLVCTPISKHCCFLLTATSNTPCSVPLAIERVTIYEMRTHVSKQKQGSSPCLVVFHFITLTFFFVSQSSTNESS